MWCAILSVNWYCNFLSSDTYCDTGNKLPLFFMCLKIPEINISSTELKKLEFEHIRIFFCLLFVVCSLIFIWIVKYKQIHNEVIDFLFIYVMKNEKSKEQLLINHRTVVSKCITILSGYFEKKIAIIPQYEMFGG